MKNLRYICTHETDPRANLALESYLLQTVGEDECILFLWQNRNTVVIGRNQNCWKECKIAELEGDGGFLVRRLSGGGAVYHDAGNLNFTFLVHERNYNLDTQLDVILQAVRRLGVPAKKTGRNDIAADGRKFSGNAFYTSGERKYHHGTILVHANMADLSRYLNVSAEKLRIRGIDSVKSRVINLVDLNPGITIESVRESLLKSFSEVYGGCPTELEERALDTCRIAELTRKFSAWHWNYGRPMPFTYEIGKRFAWGEIQLQLRVNCGRVNEAAVFSDAMDADFIEQIAKSLKGCIFSAERMQMAIGELALDNAIAEIIAKDVRTLLLSEYF